MQLLFILQNILALILALMGGSSINESLKCKKNLGAMQTEAVGGFKHTDRTQFLTFLICTVFWALLVYTNKGNEDNFVFVLGFGAAILLFLISSIVNLSVKPGFYENGISTGSGMLLYKQITNYSIQPKKNDPDVCYIYFNQKSGFFSNGFKMRVAKEEVPELKKVLKKKASFK